MQKHSTVKGESDFASYSLEICLMAGGKSGLAPLSAAAPPMFMRPEREFGIVAPSCDCF